MLKNQKIAFYKVIKQALIQAHKIDEVVNKADKVYVDDKFTNMTATVDSKFTEANTNIANLNTQMTTVTDDIKTQTTQDIANAIAMIKGDVDVDHDTLKELADAIVQTAADGADDPVTADELNEESSGFGGSDEGGEE